ncbi:hypothetical protein [uncultured Maritimibacter sp.]|uniref:hypothetical protein n=1 Tax=uncultured Maritimibacter sp. TaxID=991866 RepID=UPI00261BE213|nr:hypothetical protein [uncultured Maritimibacter sp.]
MSGWKSHYLGLVPWFAVALSLAAPQALRADSTRWTIVPRNEITPTTRATICPHEDPGRGTHNCISLECTPNDPLTLAATIAGFGDPDHLRLTIDLAGRAPLELLLPVRDDGRFAIGLSGRHHRATLEALQSGASGTVTFATDAHLWRDHLPLAGSREAIDHALAACWTDRADPDRDPDRAARDEVRAFCADTLNAPAVLTEGFSRHEDLDGDGKPDWLINYGAATCGPIGSAWCGWAGCDLAIHLAREDGYLPAFRGIAEGFRLQGDRIILRRHVSECGDSATSPCGVAYRFVAEGLARIGSDDWLAD